MLTPFCMRARLKVCATRGAHLVLAAILRDHERRVARPERHPVGLELAQAPQRAGGDARAGSRSSLVPGAARRGRLRAPRLRRMPAGAALPLAGPARRRNRRRQLRRRSRGGRGQSRTHWPLGCARVHARRAPSGALLRVARRAAAGGAAQLRWRCCAYPAARRRLWYIALGELLCSLAAGGVRPAARAPRGRCRRGPSAPAWRPWRGRGAGVLRRPRGRAASSACGRWLGRLTRRRGSPARGAPRAGGGAARRRRGISLRGRALRRGGRCLAVLRAPRSVMSAAGAHAGAQVPPAHSSMVRCNQCAKGRAASSPGSAHLRRATPAPARQECACQGHMPQLVPARRHQLLGAASAGAGGWDRQCWAVRISTNYILPSNISSI